MDDQSEMRRQFNITNLATDIYDRAVCDLVADGRFGMHAGSDRDPFLMGTPNAGMVKIEIAVFGPNPMRGDPPLGSRDVVFTFKGGYRRHRWFCTLIIPEEIAMDHYHNMAAVVWMHLQKLDRPHGPPPV